MVLKDLLFSSPLAIPFNTGAEVTATVSAVEPLSRFVRHLFYPVPVSLLHLHRFMASVLRAGQCPAPTNNPGNFLLARRGGSKPARFYLSVACGDNEIGISLEIFWKLW